MPDLLLELGTEELPARFIGRANEYLENRDKSGSETSAIPLELVVRLIGHKKPGCGRQLDEGCFESR